MPRDYAQRGHNERRQTTSRKTRGAVPGWVWLCAGLSIGLAIAAFVYIGRPINRGDNRGDAVVLPAETKPARPLERGGKEPLTLPPKQKSRFTFYELLPNQEMIVPREDVPQKTAPGAAPTATTGETYFIQVASYRSVDEAEKQKAALALLGAEARIEKVTIDNRDTYYRVRIGPEKNLLRAQSLLARLEDNGVPAMLVKVRN